MVRGSLPGSSATGGSGPGTFALETDGCGDLLGLLRQPWAWGEFPAAAHAALVAAYESLTGPMPPVAREP
jgi:hypothetical protein